MKRRIKSFEPPAGMSAEQFRYIRVHILELQQVELAELIGVRSHSVYRYEADLRSIPRMLAMTMRMLGAIKGTYIGQQFGL